MPQTTRIRFVSPLNSPKAPCLPYVLSQTTKNITTTKWDVDFPLTVGENQIFVMGDNRLESMDSRDSRIGLIDERYVLGKALFRVYRDAEHRNSFADMFGGI